MQVSRLSTTSLLLAGICLITLNGCAVKANKYTLTEVTKVPVLSGSSQKLPLRAVTDEKHRAAVAKSGIFSEVTVCDPEQVILADDQVLITGPVNPTSTSIPGTLASQGKPDKAGYFKGSIVSIGAGFSIDPGFAEEGVEISLKRELQVLRQRNANAGSIYNSAIHAARKDWGSYLTYQLSQDSGVQDLAASFVNTRGTKSYVEGRMAYLLKRYEDFSAKAREARKQERVFQKKVSKCEQGLTLAGGINSLNNSISSGGALGGVQKAINRARIENARRKARENIQRYTRDAAKARQRAMLFDNLADRAMKMQQSVRSSLASARPAGQ